MKPSLDQAVTSDGSASTSSWSPRGRVEDVECRVGSKEELGDSVLPGVDRAANGRHAFVVALLGESGSRTYELADELLVACRDRLEQVAGHERTLRAG